MANVILNPGSGAAVRPTRFDPALTALFIKALSDQPMTAVFSTAGSATVATMSGTMDKLYLKTPIKNGFMLASASFNVGADRFIAKSSGDIQKNPSPTTGLGSSVGALTPLTGELSLNSWAAGSASDVANWRAVAGAPVNGSLSPFNTYAVTFRTATAPIRTGGFSVLGTMQDGTTFNVSADSNGYINTPRVKGKVNYTTGVCTLVGTSPTQPIGVDTKTDLAFLGIPGVTTEYVSLISQETLRYNAVAFTYLPLDADLLGIDPVRLPSDGRVPIFRAGKLAVVGHTESTTPATATVGGTVNCGRNRLSRVRVIGSDGLPIASTNYTEDLEAGTVTFTSVTGFHQPVHVEHRIEDTGLIRDTQIDGTITFTRQLTHNFPLGSYVSSCLRSGDLKARVSLVFDQATWDNVTFADALVGSAAPGTYNTTSFPIVVRNDGALSERWAMKFTNTTSVDVIGEHVGNIGNFPIASVIAPVNPITGQPYFTIQPTGWGSGWASGNVVRFNTVGAMFPVWMVRTVQQGPESAADYSFLLVVRGDVDNPLA